MLDNPIYIYRMIRSALIVFGWFFTLAAVAQNPLLQSGPMVGYSTMAEVLLWVQTTEATTAQVEYWEAGSEQVFTTELVSTRANEAFIAKLIANKVKPGKHYQYRVLLNGTPIQVDYPLEFQSQALWQWREDPPSFSFALGSCNYINEPTVDRPGEPYGGQYDIFGEIHKDDPDFMVWLGDNTYLREVDWNSRTGIFHRNTHTRSVPEVQPLLGSVHHYAIWDDHDYGPNDSDRGFWNKEITTEAFRLFWGNPNYNVTGAGGITGTFTWQDVQFFLLDDRYFRAPNSDQDSTKSLIGQAQMQWLKDALTFSKASFKFICIGGQVVNSGRVFENYATFPVERRQLLKVIEESGAWGVMFLTGDRHHSELARLERSQNYPLYDFTVSPLTSGAHTPDPGENPLMVPGTLVTERNYGMIEISGPRTDRHLKMKILDSKGQLLWERAISSKELRPPQK